LCLCVPACERIFQRRRHDAMRRPRRRKPPASPGRSALQGSAPAVRNRGRAGNAFLPDKEV